MQTETDEAAVEPEPPCPERKFSGFFMIVQPSAPMLKALAASSL